MNTLSERLNFSSTQDNDQSIEIKKFNNVNFFETLCLYCANYDIDLDYVTPDEFDIAVDVISDYGQSDKNVNSYFLWID